MAATSSSMAHRKPARVANPRMLGSLGHPMGHAEGACAKVENGANSRNDAIDIDTETDTDIRDGTSAFLMMLGEG